MQSKSQPDDTIVIKAPAGTKTAWVRQAQSEGKKLSDWITQRMEQAGTLKAPPPPSSPTALLNDVL